MKDFSWHFVRSVVYRFISIVKYWLASVILVAQEVFYLRVYFGLRQIHSHKRKMDGKD
jgi:hypothetical protein